MTFLSTRPSSVLGASLLCSVCCWSCAAPIRAPRWRPRPARARRGSPTASTSSRRAAATIATRHGRWATTVRSRHVEDADGAPGRPRGQRSSGPEDALDRQRERDDDVVVGPWGRSYTANLTSDRETGIGAWTEQQFIDTIRTGKHWGNGRPCCRRCPGRPSATSPTMTSRRCSRTCRRCPRSATRCPTRWSPLAAAGAPAGDPALEDRARPCRSSGPRPLPGDGQGLRRLPHADEDGRQGPRVRHARACWPASTRAARCRRCRPSKA